MITKAPILSNVLALLQCSPKGREGTLPYLEEVSMTFHPTKCSMHLVGMAVLVLESWIAKQLDATVFIANFMLLISD